jgi:periplasmic protein TonB
MTMSATNEGALQQANLGRSRKATRGYDLSPPVASSPKLFATAIIEEDVRDRGKRAAKAGLAFAVQAAVVGVLLLIPLLFTEGLDLYKSNSTLLVAPPPPAAPPPPMVHAQAVAPKQFVIKPQLTAPTVIPRKIAVSAPDAGAAPSVSDMTGGVPGGVGDVLGGSLAGAPPPPAPAVAARPKGPIRISTGMKEPRLLYAPNPVYSPIAKAAHIEGTVILDAIIDEHGNVVEVHAVSGPALLMSSALKAVSERKYEPTILDGEPTAIRLNVKVEFKLS